jgi:hypothetical protein
MNNLTRQMRIASLLSLILLACAAAFGQLTPSQDAFTSTADPTTNYGAKTLLDVESASQTAYIQFNLSSIPTSYTSANITKATLKLYVNTVTKAGSFNVDYVNGTWTESTITSGTAPALGTTIAASVPLVTADKNQYILIDITPAVQAWLSGTANDGIALVGNSPVDATFDSKESTTTSHAAELDIVFAGGGGSGITGITTAVGSGLIGGGTSGTLNLSLTNACGASQILQWSGSAWVCASPGTGTITGVTAGTDLTGGGTGGNVTLSLNTAATNALYAQLGAANTFTSNQDFQGTVLINPSGVGNATSLAVISSGTGNAIAGEAGSTGTAAGVYGYSASSTGYGVYGTNVATTGNAPGVYGTTAAASGYGVLGVGPTGVEGDNNVGDGDGVVGTSSGEFGIGVLGSSSFFGVYGKGGLVGVAGQADGSSSLGYDLEGLAGIWGDTGGASGQYLGALATADSNTALLAANNDSTGDYPAMQVENFTTQTHNPVFQTSSPNTYSGSRHCTIDTSANLTCTGVVSGVVQQGDGKQTATYAMQSAENWLEDAGPGQLSGGSASIEIDSAFAQTVNTGVEYHVFLTPNGDSKGLYVSHKTATSFEVHEQGEGSSSIAFDYRIMAKRKGYENVHLEDVTARFTQHAAPSQKAKWPVSSVRPRRAPEMPASAPMLPLSLPKIATPIPVRSGAQPEFAQLSKP